MARLELVRFAEKRGDDPRLLVVTEKQLDAWLVGEPQEGYGCLELIGDVSLTDEAIQELLAGERP